MVRKLLFLHCNMLLPLLVGVALYCPGTVTVVRNHLPDMLWSYALVFSLMLILGEIRQVWILSLVAGIWGFTMEILQLLKLSPGTFDVWDILAEFVAAFIAAAVLYFWRMRNEEVKGYFDSVVS